MSAELTEKQRAFVREYLVDLNGKQAAIRAGYAAASAEVQASRLLRNAQVKAAVDEALAARAERVEVKADDVLRELLRLARVDIGEAFDEHHNLRPLKEMSAEVRRAIAGIEITALGGEKVGSITKVKFWPKVQALELLGKHLKLFTEKHEHSGETGLTVVVQSLAEGKGKK